MKKTLLFALLLLISFNVNSQVPEVTFTKNISSGNKSLKRSLGTILLHADAEEIITNDLATVYTNNVIAVYDFETLSMKETFIIKTPKIDGKYANNSKMIFHKDKITVFYMTGDDKSNSRKVSGKIIDRDSKKDEVKLKKLMSLTSKAKKTDIDYLQSPDKSKILFIGKPSNSYKYDILEPGQKMDFGIFDLSLNLLLEKELEFPKSYGVVIIHQVLLSNNGCISVVITPNADDKEINGINKVPMKCKIIATNMSQKNFEEVAILETGINLNTCRGYASNDTSNVITFFGLFSLNSGKSASKSIYNGVFTLVLNTKMLKWKNEFYNDLNEKNIKKIENKTEKFQGRLSSDFNSNKNIDNLTVNSIFHHSKGITIYGELNYKHSVSGSNGGSAMQYMSMQAVVFDLDIKGDLINVNMIPKAQRFITNDEFCGYLPSPNGNSKSIVFTDSPNNYGTGNPMFNQTLPDFKKSVLSFVTIDAKGKLTKEAVTEAGKLSPVIDTRDVFLVNGNTYVALGVLFKWKHLGVVKIAF